MRKYDARYRSRRGRYFASRALPHSMHALCMAGHLDPGRAAGRTLLAGARARHARDGQNSHAAQTIFTRTRL